MRQEDLNSSLEQIERLCKLFTRRDIQLRDFVLSVMEIMMPMMNELYLPTAPAPENPYTIRADGVGTFFCSGCGRSLESSYAICHQCHDRTAGERTQGGAMTTFPFDQPLLNLARQANYIFGVDRAVKQAQVPPESVSFAKTECPECHEPIFYAVEKRASSDGRTSAHLNCPSCIEGLVLIIKDEREAIVAIMPASNVLEAYGSGTDCQKVTCQSCGDIWIMPASMDYILCDRLHLRKDPSTGKVSTTRCDTVIQRAKEKNHERPAMASNSEHVS